MPWEFVVSEQKGTAMREWFSEIVLLRHGGAPALLETVFLIIAILSLAAALYFLLSRGLVPLVAFLAERTRIKWDAAMVRHGVFHRLAALGPGMLVRALANLWLTPDGVPAQILLLAAHLWILLISTLVLYAFLNALTEIYNKQPFARQMPIRGFVQSVKLVILIVVLLIAVSTLMGRSPALLVSGLGAMTAVLMLIFKDPIMGFVAGIQLSANRMLAVGDWLEMPKYQADGDVIDITLTTVKVRNWDQTITTVPTYALIADSFKNWRGMQEIGGRRIMRSLLIDMHSVHFMMPEEIERLRKAQLISSYIEDKLEDIERDNRRRRVDPSSPINGRQLTNLGTFRAYLYSYLRAHPGIHPDLIMMVRQLQPRPEGLPMEIYAFTRDTAWVKYEGVQADIFDHILAVIPEFGLRVFQVPSGSDMRRMLS